MMFDPHEKGRLLFALAEAWERDDVSPRDIFHAYALAFGHALSTYCAPETAIAFMEQELGRIRHAVLSAGAGSETRQ